MVLFYTEREGGKWCMIERKELLRTILTRLKKNCSHNSTSFYDQAIIKRPWSIGSRKFYTKDMRVHSVANRRGVVIFDSTFCGKRPRQTPRMNVVRKEVFQKLTAG